MKHTYGMGIIPPNFVDINKGGGLDSSYHVRTDVSVERERYCFL